MARVRVHQHVNPLASYYRNINVDPVVLEDTFEDGDLPLHIDIGCGRGRFLKRCAENDAETNFLGLEIREPLVNEANEIVDEIGLSNIKYVFCNAPLDLGKVLENVPSELIELFSIQFPDPWFKKKHAKRRMVNETLVKLIDELSTEDTHTYIQTDIEDLFQEMTRLFDEADFAKTILEENFVGIKTEREISVENRGLPVFRSLHKKSRRS